MDPYSRVPRSPKSRNQQARPLGLEGLSQPFEPQECKSPTSDQVSNFRQNLKVQKGNVYIQNECIRALFIIMTSVKMLLKTL